MGISTGAKLTVLRQLSFWRIFVNVAAEVGHNTGQRAVPANECPGWSRQRSQP
jgi:hypothetical protein